MARITAGGKLSASLNKDDWKKAAKAMTKVVERLQTVQGVASIHAQYAEPIAVLVVLVESDAARKAVYSAETQLFRENPELPIDFLVQKVEHAEVSRDQEALEMAYGRLWPPI